MSKLVVGKSYKKQNLNLGEYIEHKVDGFSSEGPEYVYIFKNGKLYDPDPSNMNEITKLNVDEMKMSSGGKMRSYKSKRRKSHKKKSRRRKGTKRRRH